MNPRERHLSEFPPVDIVGRFSEMMTDRVKENADIGSWEAYSPYYLLARASEKIDEVRGGVDAMAGDAIESLVDAANYLMMAASLMIVIVEAPDPSQQPRDTILPTPVRRGTARLERYRV